MIYDAESMFLNNVAFGTASSAVDLGCVRPGPGSPVVVNAVGNGSSAGVTALTVTDCDTVGGSYTTLMTVPATSAELNAGEINFHLPSTARQFVKVDVTGATAGSHTVGVILGSGQTNM